MKATTTTCLSNAASNAHFEDNRRNRVSFIAYFCAGPMKSLFRARVKVASLFGLVIKAGKPSTPGTQKHSRLPLGALTTAALLFGCLSTSNALGETIHVWANSPNNGPGTTWSNAFHTIQAGVDSAATNDIVLVTNDIYATGKTVTPGNSCYNRLVITKDIVVRSVNGPEVTTIMGAPALSSGNGCGVNAIRGVYLSAGVLDGFTVTNGYTYSKETGNLEYDMAGGGVNMFGGTGIITNCIITGNTCSTWGGGVYGGTSYNCTISNNKAEFGGGVENGSVIGCTITNNEASVRGLYLSSYGGGLNICTATNCIISGNTADVGGGANKSIINSSIIRRNSASNGGGGTSHGTNNNCLIIGNTTENSGGGAVSSTLINCTIVENQAFIGGGIFGGTAINCIIRDNSASEQHSYSFNHSSAILFYCCTTPLLTEDAGNITENPAFVDPTSSNYRLRRHSPCIDAGTNTRMPEGPDLNGVPRPLDSDNDGKSIIDMGCYELINPRADSDHDELTDWDEIDTLGTNPLLEDTDGDNLPDGWEYQVGLDPLDDADAYTNPDADAFDSKSEFVADTDPLDDNSFFRIIDISCGGENAADITLPPIITSVSFESSSNRVYTLYRTTNLTGGAWHEVPSQINVQGSGAIQSLPDTNALHKSFYRVGVDLPPAAPPKTLYVWPDSPADGPGTSWDTAFHTIQDGVDAAESNDIVLVTNGVYATGSNVTVGYLSHNRVVITKNIIVRSVNGPEVTIIKGAESPEGGCGSDAIRGVFMNTGVLDGFTVTNGYTETYGHDVFDLSGGGINVQGNSASITNCVVAGNHANYKGGGVYGGKTLNSIIKDNKAEQSGGGASESEVNNSVITGNSSDTFGGGTSQCTINNCTITFNTANQKAGGVFESKLNNSIVWHNASPEFANFYCSGSNTITFTCSNPLPPGEGNISNDPLLLSSYRIYSSSPCVGAGSDSIVSGFDFDGEIWKSPPTMGCDEVYPGEMTGNIIAATTTSYSQVAVGAECKFFAQIDGMVSSNLWYFGDGTTSANTVNPTHSWAESGVYEVFLDVFNADHPEGIRTSIVVEVYRDNYYVNKENVDNSEYPYKSWDTAAVTIQEAVAAAQDSDIYGSSVIVSNGVYDTGLVPAPDDSSTNRVVITDNIILKSVNGPEFTVIKGAESSQGGCGPDAVRCVFMGSGILDGLTITGGYTLDSGKGGGVFADNTSCVITNCIITGNSAYNGAGIYNGILYNCNISSNSSSQFGGGVSCAIVDNCLIKSNNATIGGGTYNSTIYNCTIASNSCLRKGAGIYGGFSYGCIINGNIVIDNGRSINEGGGIHSGTIYNSIIMHNSAHNGGGANNSTISNSLLYCNNASGKGGGTCHGSLYNCTVYNNFSHNEAGGTYESDLFNCIVWYNSASGEFDNWRSDSAAIEYTCTLPLPPGPGNMSVDPLVTSVGHISAFSPCVGNGSSDYNTGTDIDNELWLISPSMGCDEVYPENLSGDITVDISSEYTKFVNNTPVVFTANVFGMVSSNRWSFSDGETEFNKLKVSHSWNQPGIYDIIFTVFNSDHPDGVSATSVVEVVTPEEVTYYVDKNNTTGAEYPYSTWDTASTNIQSAVNAANDNWIIGSRIFVTNGIYDTGGATTPGYSSVNRVVITNNILVSSINGPEFTFIKGSESSNGGCGSDAVRGVYMREGVLNGFTVTNGYTRDHGHDIFDEAGGGVQMYNGTGYITNCVLTSNCADTSGGGVFGGTIYDCLLTNNNAKHHGGGVCSSIISNSRIIDNIAQLEGGGICLSTTRNCLVSSNTAYEHGGGISKGTTFSSTIMRNSADINGGGVNSSTLRNCIVWDNHAEEEGDNWYSTTPDIAFTCTFPLPPGESNITNNPAFVSFGHISISSPCQGAGSSNYAKETDIDGEPWGFPPSIGCDEIHKESLTGDISISLLSDSKQVIANYPLNLSADIIGMVSSNLWTFGDGTKVANRVFVSHIWTNPGLYEVSFEAFNNDNSSGERSTVLIDVISIDDATFYVNNNNIDNAEYPYNSWESASTTIQDALDTAVSLGLSNSIVLVTNGIYDTGGAITTEYSCSNRVFITKNITVRSVNGPEFTVIEGSPSTSGECGSNAVRCVFMDSGVLSGFTIRNGYTHKTGDNLYDSSGGGIFVDNVNSSITNCVIKDNVANTLGGGVYNGNLYNCILSGNKAGVSGGGAYKSILSASIVNGNEAALNGGGIYNSSITNSAIFNNSANQGSGGGVFGGSVIDSSINTNMAGANGGGIFMATADNTEINGNSASTGGGAYQCTIIDSILEYNDADSGAGAYDSQLSESHIRYNIGGGVESCSVSDSVISYNSGYVSAANDSTLTNCIVRYNNLSVFCISVSTARNCLIYSNYVSQSSARYYVCDSDLFNCTLFMNKAAYNTDTLSNCNVYNSILWDATYSSATTIRYSCARSFRPWRPESGNISVNPDMISPGHIAATSPCVGAGSYEYAEGTDIDGQSWNIPPSMGCDEIYLDSFNGDLNININIHTDTNIVMVDQPLYYISFIEGMASSNLWSFDNEIYYTNRAALEFSWTTPGTHEVVLTAYNNDYPEGVSCTNILEVYSNVHYVNSINTNNTAHPFESWATAAVTIQDAIDAAGEDEQFPSLILVTNGVYDTGGGITPGYSSSNRVVITNKIAISSVNGPEFTIIKGAESSNGGCGSDAVRGVFMSSGSINGFTVTRGYTMESGNVYYDESGGGINSFKGNGLITNCVIIDNASVTYGGGIFDGTAINCKIVDNESKFGGGSFHADLQQCVIKDNTAASNGGGTYKGTLSNCLITGNSAGVKGGGVYGGILEFCTIANNTAEMGGGISEGNTGSINNSIVRDNTALNTADNWFGQTLKINYTCTTPMPSTGTGNTINSPQFVGTDANKFYLLSDSPCIDSGSNDTMNMDVDLDGVHRPIDGDGDGTAVVDMGCYEYVAPAIDSEGNE